MWIVKFYVAYVGNSDVYLYLNWLFSWVKLIKTINIKKKKKKHRIYQYMHVTNSVEQSPSWEANRFSASREICCILCNPEVAWNQVSAAM
jgi:hypothetical protein